MVPTRYTKGLWQLARARALRAIAENDIARLARALADMRRRARTPSEHAETDRLSNA